MSYEQTIYNRLRSYGITQAGALGILGNWACESGNEPFRIQGDFSPYRTTSKAYVQALTNGSKTKAQFQSDAVGFGLAQWTYYTRKAELYDYWKASGKSIDDAEMQTDFAVKETKRDYSDLWAFLCQTQDVFTATSRFCREWERPAVNNIDARFQAAKRIQNMIDLNGGGDEPQPEPTPQPTPTPTPTPTPADTHKLELRTIDINCSGFSEVWLLQSLLKCRGYISSNPDGVFGSYLRGIVIQFQKDNGLSADGIVGINTWNKLLEM